MKNKSAKKRRTRKLASARRLSLCLQSSSCCFSGAAAGRLTSPGGIEFDPSATAGGWDEADLDAIRDSLNEKVEEGMINISMNTSPVFPDGEAEVPS